MDDTILIVCRKAGLRDELESALSSGGYPAVVADSIHAARDLAKARQMALAILTPDTLGGTDAEVAQDLSQTIGRLILVSERPSAANRLSRLGFKVDACIAEASVARDLLPRVRTLLEQREGASKELDRNRELLKFEGFTLDVAAHSLVNRHGREVPLSRAEFGLLAKLACSPERVLSRGQLLSSTSNRPDDTFDRSVDVIVWRLRHKIEPNPKRPRLIVTVPGVGYKLAAKVEVIHAAPERTNELPAEGAAVLPMRTSAMRRHSAGDDALPVERRLITVMACGLSGLDALALRLDAEEINAVLTKYRRSCSDVVAQFGSFITKISGDRIRFYFGYPEAHEHDAEWAVRAGIQIVDAVARLKVPAKLSIRIGIASDLAIIGGLGGGATTEIIGELPNRAACLVSLAAPNSVLVSKRTRDLVGGIFRYKQIGPITAADSPETVTAWQIVGENPTESRFQAMHASRLPPMVGREEEMELLLRRWRQAVAGAGSTVLISGEPGIGKSRLAKALAERIEHEPHTRLNYQCSPYHGNSALHPLVAQIERAAGFEKEDTLERRLDKLEEMIAIAGADRNEAAPLLAALLSIPTVGRYRPLTLSPAQQRKRTLAVLLDLVAGLARQRPVLIIFEDVNWADATSLEWLDLATNLARRLPILLIITYRPEFRPAWSGLLSVRTLVLGRLEPHDVRAMIKGICGERKLQAAVVDRIVGQTDGIPLYVEELTRIAIASAVAAPGSHVDVKSRPLAIPPTLQDSFMARIDRLGSAREVAQIGAVIGREFSYALLSRLVGLDDFDLAQVLGRLERSELVFRHGEPPEAIYSFSHALVREAAYETLPKMKRQDLHRRIAKLLSHPSTSADEPEPEVIARHYTEAGLVKPAAEWWGKAAELALSRSAYAEAISNFRKALSLTQEVVAGPEQHRLLLGLQIGYGQALIAARGHGAPETTAAFVHARELASAIEDGNERLAALYGMWSGSFARGELAPMRELARHIAEEVEGSPELSDARVLADRLLGSTAWFHGDYPEARLHLERAIADYDTTRHAPLALRFGQDVGVCAMVYLAIVLWTLGETLEARRHSEAARELALQGGHVPTIAYMLVHECALACVANDPQAARLPAQAVVDLSHQHGLPLWLVGGTFCLGWAAWHAGEKNAGLIQMREAMELCREQGAIFLPMYAFLRAEAEALSGDVETGLTLVVDQLAEIERSGQCWLEAELHRRRAQLLMQRSPPDVAAAEAAFNRALAVARAQQARLFELRAAIGLARLYHAQSRIDAARDVLAAVSARISGMSHLPEARDVQQAILELA